MIPDFVKVVGSTWKLLPPGIHDCTLHEVYQRFAINAKRQKLFEGLKQGLDMLFNSGCPGVYLDGSYITEKPIPGDYEVAWEMEFVDPDLVDPVLFDFANKRYNQKKKYFGEYFPATLVEVSSGRTFLEFFQVDKDTGASKGIIRLSNYLKKGGLK